MSAFCTKCGSALTPGTAFCSSCGTPMAAAAPTTAFTPVAPARPVQPTAAYPPQTVPYPAPLPTSSGGALKIILIVIAVLVGLGLMSAGVVGFMAWRVARSVNVNSNGNGVSVVVPGGGTISAGDSTASDADLGVPAYPGAVREKGGMNMDSGSASMVMAHFSTDDSMSKVADYYKGKMGVGAVSVSTGNGIVLNSGGQNTDRIMVTIGPGSADGTSKTAIVIMRTKKK